MVLAYTFTFGSFGWEQWWLNCNVIGPTQLTTSVLHTHTTHIISSDYCHTTHYTPLNAMSAVHISSTLLPQALLFRALCFVASVLGLLYNPFFFSLHLLDLVWSSASLQNVLKSVMLNYKQVGPERIPLLLCLVTLHHARINMYMWNMQWGRGTGNPPPLLQSIT